MALLLLHCRNTFSHINASAINIYIYICIELHPAISTRYRCRGEDNTKKTKTKWQTVK